MTIQIKEVNCLTGEEIIREATAKEIEQIKIDNASGEAMKTEAIAKAAARQAILDRLGLTEDEAKILLG